MGASKRGGRPLAALPDPDDSQDPSDLEGPSEAVLERSTRNEAFVDPAAQPIPVSFGSCPCPFEPKPHPDGDTIYLHPELDVAGGFTFTSHFVENSGDESGMPLDQALGMAYLAAGISGWTFVQRAKDGSSEPVPASRANIALLKWTPAVGEVAEVAAKRYGAAALLPLVARVQRLSRTSQTASSTSPRKASSRSRRKR